MYHNFSLFSESSPTCSTNFQPDGVVSDDLEFCGFSPDEIVMSCGVKFAGNIPPKLEWKQMSTGTAIPSNITVDTSTAFKISMDMKLTSKVNLEDIVCHTTLHGKSHISCRKPNPKQICESLSHRLVTLSHYHIAIIVIHSTMAFRKLT